MNNTFLEFPSGMPGAALLLLRIAAASMLLEALVQFVDLPLWAQCGLVILALGLGTGFCTKLAALLTAALALAGAMTLGGVLGVLVGLGALNAGTLPCSAPAPFPSTRISSGGA
ncbi:MAG: hypothetical protein WDN08_20085 [Rhizomicrobium sp.]